MNPDPVLLSPLHSVIHIYINICMIHKYSGSKNATKKIFREVQSLAQNQIMSASRLRNLVWIYEWLPMLYLRLCERKQAKWLEWKVIQRVGRGVFGRWRDAQKEFQDYTKTFMLKLFPPCCCLVSRFRRPNEIGSEALSSLTPSVIRSPRSIQFTVHVFKLRLEVGLKLWTFRLEGRCQEAVLDGERVRM